MERTQKLQSVASIPFLQEPQDSSQATKSSKIVEASPSSTEIASFSVLGISSLEIIDHTTGAGKVHPLAKEVIAIGGDSTNDIVIDNSTLSDFHLQIVRQDNQWVLIYPHLGQQQTLHGLFYERRQIREDEAFRKPLVVGDVFHISDELGTIVTLAYHQGHLVPQASILPQIDSTLLQTTGITHQCLQNDDVVQNHSQVSQHHTDFAPEEGIYHLTDLNSANYTHVNEIPVTSNLPEPDDEVRVDPFKSISAGTDLTQYNEIENIRIDTVCLKKMTHNRTILLNDISLSIPPSSFIAIVGSSGTGKSTLLDALNGLRPAHWGAVFYNGQDYYDHLADFRGQIGYLPQEDIIHRNLTVERALYYSAKLRLPCLTQAQVEQRVDEVLEVVEMTHRRKLLIKKLSGGQRKRISIALELLAHPSVFFLDEPTSGLDPGLDRKIMLLLRKLADKGHTILLATHATNNINVCDTICFLAHGGRLVYFGPPEEAITYFQLSDFAEIYNFLEPTDDQPTIPQNAEERFRQSSVYQKYIAEPLEQRLDHVKQSYQSKQNLMPSPKGGKRSKQFRVLCQRYLELLWNDKWNLAILLLQAPITGIILFIILHSLNEAEIFKPPITMITQGDAKRYLLVMSFATLMFGCINSAHEIIKEAHIYRRERAVSLGIIPYMFSKIIILSIICLLQCAILLTIMSLEAHFYDGIFLPSVWEIYITLALTSITGVFIGLTISAFVRNNDQAVSFIPLVLLPQLIFSGSLFPLKGIPLQIFGAFFSLRWSMAALGSIQNLPGNGDKVFGTCDSCNTFQHNLNYLLFTWLALIATILILGMLTAYFLKRKDTNG